MHLGFGCVEDPGLNEDFVDILRALREAGAKFLVIGAYALAGHGFARATGDLDIWVEPTTENAARVWQALLAFGAPLTSFGVQPGDFTVPGTVIQVGQPPRRIDFLTSATALDFESAWRERVEIAIGDVTVPLLGRQQLIENKRAVGRPQDLADVDALVRTTPPER
ncbi:MAG: hypothetical protein AB7Q01_15340 [Gammaproteobacteria bacterium]